MWKTPKLPFIMDFKDAIPHTKMINIKTHSTVKAKAGENITALLFLKKQNKTLRQENVNSHSCQKAMK